MSEASSGSDGLRSLPVVVPFDAPPDSDPISRLLTRRLPWLSPGEVFSEQAFGVGDWPSQGWKLHVSATPVSAPHVLDRVIPVLLSEGVRFKAANSIRQLLSLNGGLYGASQIGKFITVYPADDAQAVRLAVALDQATAGLAGPRVASDRPLRPGSLVHYRYGAFRLRVEDSDGSLAERYPLLDPSGRLAQDRTLQHYLPPSPEVVDPFEAAGAYTPPTPRHGPLAERYLVVELLGRSWRGGVFKALDVGADPVRPCLVKELWHDVGTDQYGRDARAWGHNEADILLRHAGAPFLPRCYGRFVVDDNLYVVMEFVDGTPLSQWSPSRTGGLPLGELADVARESAQLLAAVHAHGLVLRDFKPDNLIRTPDGRYRLVDFGLAFQLGDERPPFGLGTLLYMGPEQAADAPPAPAHDVFSWGAVLHYLAAGPRSFQEQKTWSEPFPRPPLAKVRPAVPLALAAVIDRAVAWDPADRFPTMGDASAALEDALAVVGGGARERAAPRPTGRSRQAVGLTPAQWLGKAQAVGDALCRAAHHTGGGASWPASPGAPCSPDIYDGAAGITLFLAALGRASGEARYGETAREAARWLMGGLWGRGRAAPGLHCGEAGVGYAFVRLAALLDEPAYHDAALLRARRLEGVPFETLDLLYGAAGTALFLAALAQATDDGGAWRQARAAADYLVRTARPADRGSYWNVPPPDPVVRPSPYLGLFHGAAGIGWSLLAVGRATGEESYLAAARSAGELLLAQAAQGVDGGRRWPRSLDGDSGDLQAQCHGAGGVGKFLLALAASTGDDRYRRAAEEAAVTIVAEASGRETSGLCHGVAGDVSFILDCYQALHDRRYLTIAAEVAAAIDRFGMPDEPGVYAAGSDGLAASGLHLGYAGVGAAFLRLAAPDDQRDLLLP